jgi:AhpD family alkylhydroperoxidase
VSQRLNIAAEAPDLDEACLGVGAYLHRSVDPALYELVKLRASIVNECAFCVDRHSHDALAAGETPTRLFAVAAWRETPFFTPAERAALALTDSVTLLGSGGIPDDVWNEAAAHFDSKELIDLVGAIAMINLWYRIAVPLRATPRGAAA